jgi:hypothetical protein
LAKLVFYSVDYQNKADRSHRPNRHEVRTDQEAKEVLEELLLVDQAGRQPHRRPSKAEPKEPTTYKLRASTTLALMVAYTVVKHTTEGLVVNTPKDHTVFISNTWAYRC